MLLRGTAELFGLREDRKGFHFAALDRTTSLCSIAGEPAFDAVERALVGAEEVITPTDYPLVLAGWHCQLALLYQQRYRARAPARPGAAAELVDVSTLGADIPNGLREELLAAAPHSPVAATVFEGRPVAFCYGVATETLCDLSIDTLEPFRGRGFAGLCVDLLIDVMAERGKQTVWGALLSNHASRRLAEKLGFTPVDEIAVYSRVD